MERVKKWHKARSEFMDENTLKIIAAFTSVGQLWPVGAWICYPNQVGTSLGWYKIENTQIERLRIRNDKEISELEANQRGFFRNG